MRNLFDLIIRPIMEIFGRTKGDSEKSKDTNSFGSELGAFIGGWVATLYITSLGFRFVENKEWGTGFLYILFMVLPTAISYPGIYLWVKDYSSNRLIVMISSIFLAPLFILVLWGIFIIVGRLFSE